MSYSYIMWICASKLPEPTNTKEKILKTVSSMLFGECPPSYTFLFACIQSGKSQ